MKDAGIHRSGDRYNCKVCFNLRMTFEENCNIHYSDVVHVLPASSHPQTKGYINYLPAWPLAAYCETVYPPSSALSSLGNKICLLKWKQGGTYELSEFQTLLSLCHALQSLRVQHL